MDSNHHNYFLDAYTISQGYSLGQDANLWAKFQPFPRFAHYSHLSQRSCVDSLTDNAVKSSKRRAAEASRDKVVIGSDPPLENVPHYLGSRLHCDGSDEADVGHRSGMRPGPGFMARRKSDLRSKRNAIPA